MTAQRLNDRILREDEPDDGGACVRGSLVGECGVPVVEDPGTLYVMELKSSTASSSRFQRDTE